MKSNTLKKIIFSLVIVGVVLALDVLFLINTNKGIDEIERIKKQIVQESVSIRNINETKRKTDELNVVEDKINSVLIQEKDVVPFIGFVEQLSSDNNLSININNVDFNNPENEDEIGELIMNFSITGTWSGVTNFIGQIEKTQYLINVKTVRLSAVNNQGAPGWSALINLRGYTK